MFKRLLIIFLLLNTFCQLSAQKYTADVQQLGIEDGLAHRQVSQVFEDKDGFFWMATVKDLQRYDGYKIKSLRGGADDYLTKPFNTEELLVRTTNLIETRKKLQEKFAGALTKVTANSLADSFSNLDQCFIENLKKQIEENLANKNYKIEDLTKNLLMSRTQFFRKLKAITNQTANEFIRNY